MEENTGLKFITGVAIFFIVLLLFTMLNPFVVIGAGERGVVMNWGNVQDYVLDEGLHFRTPFVQSVKKVSVRVQKSDIKTEGASRDLQVVNLEMVVNWAIKANQANKVYQTVGNEEAVFDNIVAPAVSEVAKASTARKNAEEIITKRPELKLDIDDGLDERLAAYGIVLKDVSLVDLDFSPEFNKAIEDKQIADQQAQQAKFTAQRAIKEAEAIVNKAKGDAEAQRLQQETLTEPLLRKMYLEKWNGKLPNVVTEGSSLLIQP